MRRPTVLLADDHQIVVEGLRTLLEADFELVGVVGDGRALVAAAEKLRPDVIVVDVSMPLLNGIEAVLQIRKSHPDAKVVFLTMHSDATYARRAFEAGASAFILKHSAASELMTAIREALHGRTYVTPRIAEGLLQAYKSGLPDPIGVLTTRQREVLQLLAEGFSARRVAAILHVSPRTVEFHKYRIMEQLGIRTSAELTQYAVRHGIAGT